MAERNDSGNNTEVADYWISEKGFKIMSLTTYYALFFFGFIGNIFSLIVWSKGTRCRNLQCSMYFRVLALSDILVLVICVGLFPTLFILLNVQICKATIAVMFAVELGPEISPWIVVSLSMERALSMMFPLKFRGMFAKRRALISFGCIIVVLVVLQFSWVFSVHYDHDQIENCTITNDSLILVTTRIRDLKILILCAFPLFFVTICNALIAYRLFRMRKLDSVTNGSQRNRRFATFTILTIVTGILHCISTLPTVLIFIAVADAYTTSSEESLSQKWYGKQISNSPLWAFIQATSIYINNSFNFYVYCLVGRDFRADLKDILCCWHRISKRTNRTV